MYFVFSFLPSNHFLTEDNCLSVCFLGRRRGGGGFCEVRAKLFAPGELFASGASSTLEGDQKVAATGLVGGQGVDVVDAYTAEQVDAGNRKRFESGEQPWHDQTEA